MKKVEINIAKDILQSSVALYKIGRKVSDYINERKFLELDEPLLLIFNLLETDPVDYKFMVSAFENTIRKNFDSENLFLAYRTDVWAAKEVIKTYLVICRINASSAKSDEDQLRENGKSLLLIEKNNEMNYVSSLDEKHLGVLKEIESRGVVDSTQIQSKFQLKPEETTSILNKLLHCKFIYRTEGSMYHSIKSLILKT